MANNNLWTGKGLLKTKKTITINDPNKGSYEVTDILLSVRRMVKNIPKYTIVPLEAWGEVSKLTKDLKEGDIVVVEGHFENKKWQNKAQELMTKNLIVVEKISLAPNQ